MTQGYVTLYRALDECINHITNAKNDEELEQWLNAQKSIIREIENYVEAHETKIDLIQLKAYLENKYDNKFEYDEVGYAYEPMIRAITKEEMIITIHISRFNTNDKRHHQQFYSLIVDKKGKGGFGAPYETLEEVEKTLAKYLKRKESEQLSLW